MWEAVSAYFQSGQRVCLVGAFALSDTRDRFASAVNAYFERWIEALADALGRQGHDGSAPTRLPSRWWRGYRARSPWPGRGVMRGCLSG